MTERKKIEMLQQSMVALQNVLEYEGLRANAIQWANELYDEIEVLYLANDPDGTYQEELFEKLKAGEEVPWTYKEAKEALLVRIHNLTGEML